MRFLIKILAMVVCMALTCPAFAAVVLLNKVGNSPSNWSGLSTDVKPITGNRGSTFYEEDSGTPYIYGASGWVLDRRRAQGGGIPVRGTITDGVNDSGTYKVYPSSDGTAAGTKVTYFTITAAAHDIKLMNPIDSWTDGEQLIVRIKGTGARALSYDTAYRAGDTTPGALLITTVTTLTVYLKFIYNSSSSTFDYIGTAGNF